MTSSTDRAQQDNGRRHHHDYVVTRMDTFGNSQRPIPARVTMVEAAGEEQLFLDHLPVPRDAWSYDEHDRVLTWRGAFGGGHLRLSHDGTGAHGAVGSEDDLCSVMAGARAGFLCDVALDCGASYETSGGAAIGLLWDPKSTAWENARWVAKRLQLTYTVTPGGPLQPPEFTFAFEDNETGALPWEPDAFTAGIQLDTHDAPPVWRLTFKSSIAPLPDKGPRQPTGPDTVYPWWLQAEEDSAALGITGVLEIDGVAPKGTLVGFRGVRAAPKVTGYYRTSADTAPFGVFDGRLVIAGEPVTGAAVLGDELVWHDLDPEHQRRTGLPADGRLRADGASLDGAVRLSTEDALAAISLHRDLHPQLHRMAAEQAAAAKNADIYGLLAMTPFVKDGTGAWSDVVQAGVNDSLSTIMNSCIPGDLWGRLFPGVPQPALTGELAEVAGSAVTGVDEPAKWYQSLATAVLTYGLADGSEDHCRYLNGPRAMTWLKTGMATSPVYHAHGQRLFGVEWQKHCPMTADYLADQITNAKTYEATIDAAVKADIADIKANVVAGPAATGDLHADLIAEVRNAGQYAKTNRLYWAFAFYSYNVAPGILANISLQMSVNTGSGDGTGLTRLFQQNVAVLTALDPSGFFAQRYVSTINTFLATNILPSMFGFLGEAVSFDLVKEYLQAFVEGNVHNEDAQIAEAARSIGAILQEEQADRLLHDSIEALLAISGTVQDTLALPYIAGQWLTWFSGKFPRLASVGELFGSALIGGITGLAVFNLFSAFKSWDQLSKTQRATLVIDTVQLGLQIVSAVAKRGVRLYAIFSVKGMTASQRIAAVGSIVVKGEAGPLEQGLVKIGNSTARWIGDIEGTVGKLVTSGDANLTAVLVTETTATAEEASLVSKVFGANLDEFVATRVGPLFILAGIVVSIVHLAEGESGLAVASDVLNIVSGSLMLLAMAGEWLVAGGMIAAAGTLAAMFALAGPLAVLAALAGVGLMLYELFKQVPDEIENFVNGYAAPAGFRVGQKKGSLDYAVPYRNPDRGSLLMVGSTLTVDGDVVQANPDGTIRYGAGTSLPDCVWQVTTDASGLSTIFTVLRPDPAKPPVVRYLSLMDDRSVSFQPKLPAPDEPRDSSPVVVVCQTWIGQPWGPARLTGDEKFLVSLDIKLVPATVDSDGHYQPAMGKTFLWLARRESGLVVTDQFTPSPDIVPTPGSVFTLTMAGMAPNFMTMPDLTFPPGSTPSEQQTFGPGFAVLPSTPMKFRHGGDPLPEFLRFDDKTGAIKPNGKPAAGESRTRSSITASNPCGGTSTSFDVVVGTPATVLTPAG
ncbi:hypothetical protein MUY14_13370 [Amycolatopsis sp. FBCC-B4732]|uniref:hypothetical protein n=1 Tax=Amycolatopsis sp. FBCC-B4732 TaxID=3079339 RepID=UPI001FF223F1|nr:hypothetical protein [Amycolatopsis sp. FBCC-B4732]UOX91562.1 hypothetical protein MUY14_13370 [Amycolatopsis sp. FBCC-B4732]